MKKIFIILTSLVSLIFIGWFFKTRSVSPTPPSENNATITSESNVDSSDHEDTTLLSSPRTKVADSKKERIQMVTIVTNYGSISLKLYPERAPITVKNFLEYAKDGFYEGTIFHRVVPGFVIQGGGLTEAMIQKNTKMPIMNESKNKLSNKRGTIAMARTSDPHSATSQFYINLSDQNTFLDYKEATDDQPVQEGYAVFGEVIEGMDVVDKIADPKNLHPNSSSPIKPIVIQKVIVGEEKTE